MGRSMQCLLCAHIWEGICSTPFLELRHELRCGRGISNVLMEQAHAHLSARRIAAARHQTYASTYQTPGLVTLAAVQRVNNAQARYRVRPRRDTQVVRGVRTEDAACRGIVVRALAVSLMLSLFRLSSGCRDWRLTKTGVIAGTSVTYVQPSTSTIPSSTAVVIVPTTPSTSAPPSSTQSCTSGFFSCPQSLDGGCCRNGQTCGQNRSCINPPSTTSQVPSAPIRPTSVPPVSSDSPSNSICPQGFYVCSAYYPSGCCRVGSDCQTTGSCLPTASVTVVNTNGVVIVAPTGASLATTAPGQGGSCPSAWYSCAANVGGNCCPNGFACGEACTATGSVAPSQSIVGKVAPSTAGTVSMASIWGMALGALAIGMSMILL